MLGHSIFFTLMSYHRIERILYSFDEKAPGMLDKVFLRGSNIERWLLTAVLLVLGAPWLTSSSLDIRGICSHACYSRVLYLRLFRSLVLRLFRGFKPRLVTYPCGLCVYACFVAFVPCLVIYPCGLCVHACYSVLSRS